MKFNGVNIEWLHHACFRITNEKIVIYTDPYMIINSYNDADLILITHNHYDHLDIESIKKLKNDNTTIIAPKDCERLLIEFKNEKYFVSPNQMKMVGGVVINTVPSYNINKLSENGEPFHPKEKKNVGYIFTIADNRIYIAGDTDEIPEMKEYEMDIALLPVSGRYVMDSKEAASAATTMHPKVAIPMHYGSGIGTRKNAEEFKDILEKHLRVEILDSIDQ